jgi:hypothetical protein
MCKRTTTDPLVRFFLDRYGLNLLQIPRADATVGDLYAIRGDVALPPGKVSDFVTPRPRLPRATEEPLADLSDVISDSVSLDAGLGFLGAFLSALGAGALLNRAEAYYHANSGGRLRFRIQDARRESVSTFGVASSLQGCRPRQGHPLARGYRYYLTVGVVRTASITVLLDRSSAHGVGMEADVAQIADVNAAVKVSQAGGSALRYRGSQPIAIGVELVELAFNEESDGMEIKPPKRALRIRSGSPTVFLGEPAGDAFVNLG